MPARVMKTYELVWSPTGQTIATVSASTAKSAKRQAPKPYSKFKGEIYAKEKNPVARVPVNKWLRAKVNRNGTVTIAVPVRRRKRR